MYGFSKRERGAVSVFLVIILVPCMLVASIFVDVGRVYLSKSMAESAADMALNSLMTHYDADLNDWYGMVASCQNIDEFYDASIKCYKNALKSQNLSKDEMNTLVGEFSAMIGADSKASDYLRVTDEGDDSTTIKAVDGANLANATMLKSQIVDFMKYRAPIAITQTAIDKIKNKSIPGIDDVLKSDENKPLVEKKQDYCEADEKLMRDSYNTYKYLFDNYSNGNPKPSNSLLTGTRDAMQTAREQYRELNKLMIINLYNTSGLVVFNRAQVPLNQYNYTKSSTKCYKAKYDGKTYYVNCHSRKDNDTYYIDGTELTKQFDDISKKIKAFDKAKNDFTNAVNNSISYSSGVTNDIQYWKHAADAYSVTVSGSDDYRTNLNKKADEMIKSYCALNAMMQCTPGNDLPDGYDTTYKSYKKQVENRQTKYLTAGVTNGSDSYLVLVNRLESISSNNIYNIEATSLTLSDRSTIFVNRIADISTNLIEKRNTLQHYSDVLNIAINGDSSKDIESLETLKQDAADYAQKLNDWSNQADGTDSDLAEGDRDEIAGIKASEAAGNITEQSIIDLENRLKNIKSQIDSMIATIDSFKYGNQKVKDISTYDQFKNAGSMVITESEINKRTTNSELSSYADSTFSSLFSPQGTGTEGLASVNSNDDHNLLLDVADSKTVAIPGVYQFWQEQFDSASEDEIKKYDDEKGKATGSQEKTKENAKNRKNPHEDAEDIAREIDTINKTFGNTTFFNSFVSLLKNLTGGNFENIRDNLYLSTYIMEMLSYSTIDNEGRYDILKDQGFDVSTLTKENMDDKYNSVNDKWNSDEYKDYFNKSLTNKRLCKENNAAYGCELEYILYGHENNNENINAAYGQIYEIRYVLNLISAFENFWSVSKNTNTGKAIYMVSNAIMTATAGVVPSVAVKAVIICLLTVFETSNDLNRLEAGFSVELYKCEASMWQVSLDYGTNSETSCTSVSDILSIIETKFGNFTNSCENGLRYSDYLCIFMVCGMQSNIGESMTLRCADVIQANMRKITQDDGYKLENSKTYFELDSKLKVDPLLITLPLYSDYTDLYDSSSTDWCTYNIKTIRGY